MTPLPSTDPVGREPLRWVALDERTWEARLAGALVGTVTFRSRYVVRSADDADLTGSHTSLESAKAQLEAWVRWRADRT